MIRRRPTPWIHRWSRPIIGAIAACGALLTAYLTIVKLTGGSAACPTEGCDRVLNSPYASVFGLPLTLFGCLAYIGMVVFALAPLTINQEQQKDLRSKLENLTWLFLFMGGISMTIFSGYLMYLLAFKIQSLCIYCFASAIFSVSLLVITLIGRSWEDIGQLIFTGLIVGLIVLVGTLGVYAQANPNNANNSNTPGATSPPITTTSGPAELGLANHLRQIGAKEYGAWWCPHCHEQKVLFGKEAAAKLDYIECDPKGQNARPDLCKTANIEGYPTWEIKGQFYSGTQTLEKLAELSGYTGDRQFKNSLPAR
jgi:uncharacterized membrane protein